MQSRFRAGIHSAIQQFQKVTFVPKLLCGIFPLLYLLGFIPGVEDNLLVTPGFLAPPHAKLWTIVTAIFYENSIFWVPLDIIALVGFSLLLEPLWGLKRFLIFSSLIGSISMVSVATICFLLYAISGSITILFAKLHGFIGLVCGYLVAVKQVHPDSVAFPPPAPPTLRVKHLPLFVTFVAFLLAVFKLVSFTHSLLAFNGMITSWIYLRFYEKQESTGARGDFSEAFSFATFFPEIMHPAISSLGEGLYRLLIKLRVCRAVKTYDVSGGPSSIRIALPPHSSSPSSSVDMERRKQRALKALDERLNKSNTSQQIEWPSLDEQPTTPTETTPTTNDTHSEGAPTGGDTKGERREPDVVNKTENIEKENGAQ